MRKGVFGETFHFLRRIVNKLSLERERGGTTASIKLSSTHDLHQAKPEEKKP